MAKKYEKSTTKYANRHGTKGRVSDRPNEREDKQMGGLQLRSWNSKPDIRSSVHERYTQAQKFPETSLSASEFHTYMS